MDETSVETVDARRIGLLSDTHFVADGGSDVPQALLEALRGCDLIVHLGHISSAASLDKLASVAPVRAVQTELDDQIMGDHLAGEISSGRTNGYTRVLHLGDITIGCVHDFSIRGIEVPLVDNERLVFPSASMDEIVASKFGQRVDVVAFAATHIDMVLHRQGVLLVNPGSPNLPAGARKGGLGSIAVLNLTGTTVQVEIVDLARV